MELLTDYIGTNFESGTRLQLEKIAQEKKVNLSTVVRWAVDEYLKKELEKIS